MTPLAITHFTATSALGRGIGMHLRALTGGESGLAPCHFETVELPTWVGDLGELPGLPEGFAEFDCRNTRLVENGLLADGFAGAARACIERLGAQRVGLVIGTSTTGVLSTEQAYRSRDPATGALPPGFHYETTQNAYGPARYLRARLGLTGPATVISTACSSSAKVFATAARWIEAGLVDAAIVGGIDSLCLTTLYGFHSLQLAATGPCRPFDVARDGISIGEAAAYALIERAGTEATAESPRLLGYGESSDAHHMSAPHPEGLGAQLAMHGALARASLSPSQIDYLNLHGTGTPSNDLAESLAVAAVFPEGVACSSTKGATGHTLGAAGALEAVICLLAIEHGFIPGGTNLETLDPRLAIDYRATATTARVRHAMSNSFGFGGSNAALIFGAPP
ncbi:MAG: beta-ketoacyl-[acyl-carrier-protein] synthase family protein [Steroidobacteraceae bacterium]